jgi:cell division septation protein DedD
MNYLLDDDDIAAPTEREFTLSTSAILCLFFGLVLLCGLFFEFGYSVGSHKAPQLAAQSPDNTPAPTNFNAFKPAAGLPVGASNNVSAAPQSTNTTASTSPAGNTTPSGGIATPVAQASSTAPAPIVRVSPAHTDTASPATSALGTFIVQVAAVSHQEDADLLVSALRAKGYAVVAMVGQDKFIRIQSGPFSNRHDAEAMRQRLSADGYSPIIK